MSSGPDARLHHRIEFEAGTSNNLVLSDSETHVAKYLLSETEAKIHAVDLQIAELHRQRDEHICRRERLRIAVASHKRVPPEILSYIFGLSYGSASIDPSKIPEAWALRHICSRWRSIAVNDHRLWNRISVDLELGPGYTQYNQFVDLIKSERLLDIIIPTAGYINFSFRANGARDGEAINRLIKPHSGRITRLYLALPGLTCSLFFHMFPDQFGALESLTLAVTDRMPVRPAWTRKFPPNMRSLSISGDCTLFACFWYFDWGNITDIDISNIAYLKVSEVVPTLKRWTHVETCKLSIVDDDEYMGEPIRWIEHAVLPHLRVLALSLQTATAILDVLVLPGLKKMVLWYSDLLPTASITSLIHRSSCALEELHLHETNSIRARGDPGALGALFTATPSIRNLTTRTIVLPRPILEQIGQSDLLPELEILECPVNEETKSTFLDVVERRFQRSIPYFDVSGDGDFV